MKKGLIVGSLLISFVAGNVWADTISNLKNRLDKISSFHASFVQKIIDGSGNTLQEGYGDLWVKRPNLFNWHMTQPNESILVSDGKTLWFYNPFIEQVTVTWLKDAASNTPLVLIAYNQISDWQQYNIKQNKDNFELTPKSGNKDLNRFIINVDNDGIINRFSTIEQNGQHTCYQLKSQQNDVIDESKFNFIPPRGVTIDDQRSN